MLLTSFDTFVTNTAIISVSLLQASMLYHKEQSISTHITTGHPEGHVDNPDKDDDLLRLKQKVDAGADLIVTQLFFDVDIFVDFVKRCRDIGIQCPIIPGLFPIQSYSSLSRVISFNKNHVPQKIWNDLETVKDDDQAVKDYGIDLAIQFIKRIKQETGISGFHIYTFNLERSSRLILEKLGLVPEQEYVKPLPWNPVRPLFMLSYKRSNHTLVESYTNAWQGECTTHLLETSYTELYPTNRVMG